jgi:2-amino-4-hydroxy-6-hydroxymethyldihydropteridine diphosphokinase
MSGVRAVAAIGLGSNLGERDRELSRALLLLGRVPGIVVLRRSRWIETEPEGGPPGQGRFLNGAALLETTLSPRALLDALLGIEARMGRDRSKTEKNGPRTIDLDLLLYDDLVIDEPGLTVPHARMEERLFVLEPLAEIAPERVLPSTGKRVEECLEELRRARQDVASGDGS